MEDSTYQHLQQEKKIQRRINEIAADVTYGASFKDFCSTISFMLFEDQPVNQENVWLQLSQTNKQKFDRWHKEQEHKSKTNSKMTAIPSTSGSGTDATTLSHSPSYKRAGEKESVSQFSSEGEEEDQQQQQITGRLLACYLSNDTLTSCSEKYNKSSLECIVPVHDDTFALLPKLVGISSSLQMPEDKRCRIHSAHLKLVREVGTEGIFQLQIEFAVKGRKK